MQLVTFIYDRAHRLGALVRRDGRDAVVDLNRADARLPSDMIAFLSGGDTSRALAKQVLAAPPPEAVLERASVRLAAPIPRPGKIICIGLNYRDHAAESNAPLPEFPVVFAKYANTVIGPGDAIVLPRVTEQVDYEGELGIVIGARVRDVPEDAALACVAGYLPVNDVSARDYQMRTSQWTIGKTFDTFAPMGPALVTADEVPDPHNLDLRVTIGGEVLQDSNTRHLIFSIPQLIAYLSSVMTLDPGDVIASGTPAGVGSARTPKRWLRAGETVCVEIERLGRLENPVVASDGP
ncbi:MAG: fumarylacetoacetate hydrolase family protein [Roseiflexaceae bacterium]